MAIIQDVAHAVPSHRLRTKTPQSCVRCKLVYKLGCHPVKREIPVKKEAAHQAYRVMLYKAKNAVAIRQLKHPKWQVGQMTMLSGMSQARATELAHKVVPLLEADNSLEVHIADLLAMAVDALEM